jgi:hypothetical protein
MGWTIDETDKALIGLSTYPDKGNGALPTASDCHHVGFDAFKDDCGIAGGRGNGSCNDGTGQTDDWSCPDIPQVYYEIAPEFLHQLVAVRKLLDLTGLPLAKLLTFWSDISTAGEQSLYTRLFLTHNLLGIDKVSRWVELIVVWKTTQHRQIFAAYGCCPAGRPD